LPKDRPVEVAVDRVLLIAGVVALAALLCGTLLLDVAVGGRLPLGLHVVVLCWAGIYLLALPIESRARTIRQVEVIRGVNLSIGIGASLAVFYLLGGVAWVGPMVVFFAILGAAFMRSRIVALGGGLVTIAGFAAIAGAEAAGWIPSHNPLAGAPLDEGTVSGATIAFIATSLLAFYGISAMLGFFVTLQRDLLSQTSQELEAKKDELQALNTDLEQRVEAKTSELEARNRELAVMSEIGTAVNRSLELQDIYMSFMTAARQLVPFDFASIAVDIDDGRQVQVLRVRPAADGTMEGETLVEDSSDSIHAVGRFRLVEDFAGVHVPGRALIDRFGVKSGAQVPIVCKGRTLGAFSVASRAPGRFTEQHCQLMERMAEPLALAIDNCRLYDEMRHMAETDGLTGLPNRRAISRLISHEVNRDARNGEMCSVLVLDIDNFKVFNDTLGHQAGDDLLTNFARLLRGACRDSDIVARQAGDEFTILLPGSGPREALAVSQRIHDALSATDWRYPGQDGVVVRTSIGIATYPMDGDNEEALLIMADRAMYAAKAAGGGQSRLASRLTEQQARADTSRQLRFGMLETLANRIAVRAQNSDAHLQAFAGATARAAWAIGERLALDDSEQQLLRVAALAHALGVLPDDDPFAHARDYGLDPELDRLFLKIGRMFVAGSPGLLEAVRVLARHHQPASMLPDDDSARYARILAVAERFATLTIDGRAVSPAAAIAQMQDDPSLDRVLVQMLEEGLSLPAVWRAA